MNPFDLPGPQFLLFYAIFAVIVIVVLGSTRRRRENRPVPKVDFDPYGIAYLRGGANETARVAIVSLVDRGLLAADADRVGLAPTADPQKVRHPVEQYVLKKFRRTGKAIDIFKDWELAQIGEPYREAFENQGLLPNRKDRRARALVMLLALALLLGVSGTKLAVALSRGHHNVIFLLILTFFFSVYAIGECIPRLTKTGSLLMKDLRTLYANLRQRASAIRPGGATMEFVTLVAIYGIGAVGAGPFAYVKSLFPKASAQAGSSYGSSCGSSCGGGSCGGGCGGGGCGGCGGS